MEKKNVKWLGRWLSLCHRSLRTSVWISNTHIRKPESHCVTQAELNHLEILLLQLPKCWNCSLRYHVFLLQDS